MQASKKIFVVFANTKGKSVPIAVVEQDNLKKILGPICLNISRARALFKAYEQELNLVLNNKEPEVLIQARSQIKTQGFKSFEDLFASGFKENMQAFNTAKREWEAKKETHIKAAQEKLKNGLDNMKFFNKAAEIRIAKDKFSTISVESVYWTNYAN